MSKTYQVEINEETYRKFQALGKWLNEPDASTAFDNVCEMAIDVINTRKAVEANKRFIDEDCHPSQLHPSSFDGAEAVFGPPVGMTENEVFSLCGARVLWGDAQGVLTCWKPTREQLATIQSTGRLWLMVMGGAMVPVALCAENPLEFEGVDLV